MSTGRSWVLTRPPGISTISVGYIVFVSRVTEISFVATLETWKVKALGTINKVLQSPLQLKVRNVVAGGEWATVELEAFGTCKNGGCEFFSAAWGFVAGNKW